MNFSYLLVVIILIALVILVYYFNIPKKINVQSLYNDFALSNNKFPSGFTAGREGNNYINYHVNLETANLDRRIESFPIDLDGLEYKSTPHGNMTFLDNGFQIEGISKTFTCPPNWFWNFDKETCELVPLCQNELYQTIKGINQYQFDSIASALARDTNEIYHDRVYAICQLDNSFELGYCENNYIYNQLPAQPFSTNPCVVYDICNDENSGLRHRYQIKEGVVLEDNQYYVCEAGTSVLYTCTNSQVFSETLNACVEMGICFQKPNGYTFYLDNDNYQICLNERLFTINCRFGIYADDVTDPTRSIYSCVNNICNSENFVSFYSNSFFSIPLSGTVCDNNEPITHSCPLNELSYNVAVPTNTVYTVQKDFVLNEDIKYPQEQFMYTNANFSEWACENVNLFDITDSASTVDFQYNENLPIGVFLVDGNPILNFNNYFGEIRQRIVTIDESGNQSTSYSVYDTDATKYIGFMSDDVLYEMTSLVTSKIIVEGIQMPILLGSTLTDLNFTDHGVPAYHPLTIMQMPNETTYRMSIVNGDATNFGIVFDIDASLFTASKFSAESPYFPTFFTENTLQTMETLSTGSNSSVIFSRLNYYATIVQYAAISSSVLLMLNCEIASDFDNKVQILGQFNRIPTDEDINSFPETTEFTSTTDTILASLNIPTEQINSLYNLINPNA